MVGAIKGVAEMSLYKTDREESVNIQHIQMETFSKPKFPDVNREKYRFNFRFTYCNER